MSNKHRVTRAAITSLVLSVAIHNAQARVDTDTRRRAQQDANSQQQREQLQRQSDERLRLRNTPDSRLQNAASDIDKDTDLPKEASCFQIDQLRLDLPQTVSPAQRRMGASALSQDPFYFLQQAMEPYRGRCIGHEGINLIQQRLSALILSKGYSTTRLGIPEQNLASGKLVFALLPGVIGGIRFSNPDLYASWKSAFHARPGDLLNLHDLEQGLEQLRRVPSQQIDLQIVPGERSGESDIVIDVIRNKPWRLAVSLDDSGAKGTGKLQTGINLSIDNPLGLNDLFSIGLNTDADRKGGQRGTTGNNFSYSVPDGDWAFSVAGSNYDYHQQIAGRYQTFLSSGKGQNLEFTASKLLQRDQAQKNSFQFKVGKRWNHAYIDNTEIDVQRRNATYTELAWVHQHYVGAAQLYLTLANRWGVSWFNGDADLSGRQPDSPTTRYTLQTIDATLVSPFHLGAQPLTYIATFRGQATQSALYASEQFTIGNRYTVRGFDGELTLSAERGFFLRNEVDLPLGNSRQSLYAGLDVGKVYGPTVQYLLGDKLAGAALGGRGVMKGLHYDAFLGWALYKPENFGTGSATAGFSLAYQY